MFIYLFTDSGRGKDELHYCIHDAIGTKVINLKNIITNC